ncbi:MAG: hypothetical protein M1832_002398 [Thelocarpon impressellum]|nr:MAG: hypothetical protein M1832_002398 [Thelocarpon impressellum]
MHWNPFRSKPKEKGLARETPAEQGNPQDRFAVHLLHEQKAPPDALVDIIAVHGLGGRLYDTWTDEASGKLWLKHFLPDQMQNAKARIMTFGYDADLRSRNVLDIMGFAENLLAGLRTHRRRVDPTRPIIFIGHSMGGLVIKNALLTAKDQGDPIADATFGVMFMAVPHRGSQTADWATIISGIANLATPLSTAAIEQLKRDSGDLLNLSIRFGNMQESLMFVSVLEGERTKLASWLGRGSIEVVPPESARLNLGGRREQTFSISGADHRTVCKFSSATDHQFLQVAGALEDLAENALRQRRQRLAAQGPVPAVGNGINQKQNPRAQPTPLPVPGEDRSPPVQTQYTGVPIPGKSPGIPITAASGPIVILPFPRNPDVVVRKSIFKELDEKLPGHTKQQSAAVWGLGGTGKTQIALEYAYRRHESTGCSVFWVHAANTERFEEDYRKIADKAGLPSELKGDELFEQVEQWLRAQENWLLVLDNVDDLDLFSAGFQGASAGPNDPKPPELLRFVPSGLHGSILWTTRDESIKGRLVSLKQEINANTMDEEDALAMLQGLGHLSNAPERRAEQLKLVNTLEKLPLAIAQAGAYLRQYPEISLESYIVDFSSGQLLGEEFLDRFRDSRMPNSVLRTWHLSMKKIGAISSDSAKILNASAFFDSEGIPFEFLRHTLGEHATDHTTMTAIGLLKRFSFLQAHQHNGQSSKTYQLHLLVALAIRQSLSEHEKQACATRAISVVAELFPRDWMRKEWTKCREYLPHALAVLGRRQQGSPTPEAALLLRKVAHHYMELGEHEPALSCCNQSLEMFRVLDGAESAGYLGSKRVLAEIEVERGNYDIAVKLSSEVLGERRANLGERDPDIAESMTDVAEVDYYLGRWDEAETLCQHVLRTPVRMRDLDKSSTMNCLATVFYQQGRLPEAEKLLRDVVEMRQKLIGDRHPETHLALANLAAVVSAQSRWAEAENLERKVLLFRLETLGEKHHDTLRAMANLAVTVGEQGRRKEAVELERKLLDFRLAKLGDSHPDTLYAMRNLGVTLGHLGEREEAERIAEEVLTRRRKRLGNKHPDTIRSMTDLAVCYAVDQRWEQAQKLQAEALELSQEILGREHPETAYTLANLAVNVSNQGKRKEAAEMQEKVLRMRRAMYGDMHLETATAKANLAMTCGYVDRREEAERLAREALQVRRSKLGPDHPDTLHTTGDLAGTLTHRDKWDEARQLVQEGLPRAEKTYGKEHRVTQHMRTTLDLCLKRLGEVRTSRKEAGSTALTNGGGRARRPSMEWDVLRRLGRTR